MAHAGPVHKPHSLSLVACGVRRGVLHRIRHLQLHLHCVYRNSNLSGMRMCNNDLVLSSTFDCDRSVCLRAQVLDWKADHIVKTILYLLAFGALLVGGFAIGLCSTTRFCCAAAVSAELHL